MKLVLMALRDVKIAEFMTPFVAQSVGAAARAVGDMVNESNDPPAKHPEDFSLYQVGEFETATGEIGAGVPQLIVECVNLKKGVS